MLLKKMCNIIDKHEEKGSFCKVLVKSQLENALTFPRREVQEKQAPHARQV